MLKVYLFCFSLTLVTSFLTFYELSFLMFFFSLLLMFVFPLWDYGGCLGFSYLDNLGFLLLLLSVYITILGLFSSYKLFDLKGYNSLFSFLVTLLLSLLVLSFSVNDLMLFYLYFEASLIPLMVIIMGYGFQPEKVEAGLYMLFYTVFGSLPLLLGFIYFYLLGGSLNFGYLYYMNVKLSFFLFPFLILAFLIKLPVYFFHLWLPKAHVEAPVFGSMILAGVMLKLGGYGLVRILPFFLTSFSIFVDYFVSFSLVGGSIVSIICVSQVDMKSLVAYSSVGHMMMMTGGVMSMGYYGWFGCLLIMIAHGLCSSGLFSIINMAYERMHSRSILMVRGLLLISPFFSLFWFLLCSSNMAVPPFLNFMGELSLSFNIISLDVYYSLFLGFMFFIGGAYSMYFFSISQHGPFFSSNFGSNLNLRESFILFMHLIPLMLLFLKLDLFV